MDIESFDPDSIPEFCGIPGSWWKDRLRTILGQVDHHYRKQLEKLQSRQRWTETITRDTWLMCLLAVKKIYVQCEDARTKRWASDQYSLLMGRKPLGLRSDYPESLKGFVATGETNKKYSEINQ